MKLRMLLRFIANRLKTFFIYRVLHVDDTPHRIALGVAAGIFIAWTPTIGFQMLLTILLATLLRANKLVGVPFVLISNPFTLIPVYYPSYLLGCWLLRSKVPPPDFARAMHVSGSWWLELWVNRVKAWWEATWHVLAPLWVGSVVVGLILGALSYVAIYRAVVVYRRHRRPGPAPAEESHGA